VNEADQHARHLWLVRKKSSAKTMKTDPEFYDAKIAGWWVWGQCIWIGSGWCSVQLPHLGNAGTGVHRKRPHLGTRGGERARTSYTVSYRTSGTRARAYTVSSRTSGTRACPLPRRESARTSGNARVPFQYMNELGRSLAPSSGVLRRLVPSLRPYANGQARTYGCLPRSAIS
jgi:hypothetical protein